MMRRKCRVRHDPPRSYGDCIAACVRTVIDCDDVPHVFDQRVIRNGIPDETLIIKAWVELRAWLAQRGKFIALFPSEDHLEFMAFNNPGVPYILLCGTERGDHALVVSDGKILHDPAWEPVKKIGPTIRGYYIICVIGDLL